jgi:hypothetical protein
MAGRPRSQRAQRLALSMALDLRRNGPARIEQLLDRRGHGPEQWDIMGRWEQAAARMAIRELLHRHGARLGPDGYLYMPRRGRRRRAA